MRGTLALLLSMPGVGFAATLAAGGDQTCAIDAMGGEVRCWGRGDYGEIGDGHDLLVHRAAPTEVAAPEPLHGIASGGSHSCGLSAAGGVYCWGYNASGQLGDGTTLFRNVPTPVLGLSSGVSALALGDTHTCALVQGGKVKCWGESDDGRLGTGDTSDQTQPRDVLQLTGATAIGAGVAHTCALVGGGQVKCWGYNGYGEVGDGTWTMRTIPVSVQIGMTVSAIAVGGHHTCAMSTAGAMQCWGDNNYGQLGDGTNTNRNLPVNVDGLGSGVTQMAAGGYHTCALAAGHVMKCWGYNGYGELGEGTTGNRNRPTNVIVATGSIQEMSAGEYHTCVRGAANAIQCWGQNSYGKLGAGTPDNLYWATGLRVSGLTSAVAKLSTYWQDSCAVTVNGSAMCWGDNYYGQLGNGWQFSGGGNIGVSGPTQVVSLESGVRDVAVGRYHACAARTDGTVWCWGANNYSQLADGTSITRITPVQVDGISDAVAVAAGEYFTCALKASGGVVCWGRNNVGQLGDGSIEDRDHPVATVGLDSDVVALSAGEAHICALLGSGSIRCWGDGGDGRIGDGTTTDRYLPTTVNDPGTVYASVVAGFYHTCGITAAGRAKCWGYNGAGQLGDGTTTSRLSPTNVDGMASGVSLVGGGRYFTCAVQNGQMKCWGSNESYQLGDGTTTTRTLPTGVVGLDGAIDAIELGETQTCALMAEGHTKCWGWNGDGRLGNGATNYTQSFPIDVSQWSFFDLIFADGFDP